jgi:hypothetical protein
MLDSVGDSRSSYIAGDWGSNPDKDRDIIS